MIKPSCWDHSGKFYIVEPDAMKAQTKSISLLFATLMCMGTATERSEAQIIPEQGANKTDTTVTPNGTLFKITGGIQSGNGANLNLFHSFTQFNLNSNQTANFLSTSKISNILVRVNGGASYLNGVIQVTGGNSNLYLMNPAGIVFGQNASLNVPASFTATTATGIGFGSNWFNATGANNYAALVGTPSSFAFNTPQPGAIVNAAAAGNLSVKPGQNLTLLGGTVVSTGISAPGGNVTIATVPGTNLVRISQPGNLLSLEIPTPADGQLGNWTLPISSLPQLLTGSGLSIPPGLVSTAQTLNNGDIVVSGDINTSGGNVNLSAVGNITVGNVETSGAKNGGNVNLSAVGNITAGNFFTYTSYSIGKGGDVNLSSTTGNIEVSTIDAHAENVGGTVDIRTNGLFRATGAFSTSYYKGPGLTNQVSVNASIYTSKPTGSPSGSISIQQGGTSFQVGSPLPPHTSGTDGIILITQGGNASFVNSLPDQTFNQGTTTNGIQLIFLPSMSKGGGSSGGGITPPNNPDSPGTTTSTINPSTPSTTIPIPSASPTATVVKNVQQPPQATPVAQQELKKPTGEDECNVTNVEGATPNQNSRNDATTHENSTRESEASGSVRGMGRSDRDSSKPDKDECTRRRQIKPQARLKPAGINDVSSAHETQQKVKVWR